MGERGYGTGGGVQLVDLWDVMQVRGRREEIVG